MFSIGWTAVSTTTCRFCARQARRCDSVEYESAFRVFGRASGRAIIDRQSGKEGTLKVLVTGGAGFIGSHVVDRLLQGGHDVDVVDDLSTGRKENVHPDARLHVGDIRSPELAGLVGALAPAAVVHAAAHVVLPRSIVDPLHDAAVNIQGTVSLLQACRASRVGRFVYVSTGGAAYGDTPVVPTPETEPANPGSPYGISKVTGESYVRWWASLTGAHWISLRLANVYGPRQRPEGEAGVVAIFTDRLVGGRPCVIHGDGEQTRDYVYVGDVAAAAALALASQAVGPLNVGTGRETSVNALYAALARIAGVQRPPDHGSERPGEQRRSALANDRARQLLGWSPAVSLEEGLRQTIEWARAASRA
jgi:UDP-glucose 4-epimerase